jgi:hypothetical protein
MNEVIEEKGIKPVVFAIWLGSKGGSVICEGGAAGFHGSDGGI